MGGLCALAFIGGRGWGNSLSSDVDAAFLVSLVDAVCTQTLLSPPKAVCVQIIVVVCADAAFARDTGRVDEVGVVLLAPPRLQETRKGVGLTDYFMIT